MAWGPGYVGAPPPAPQHDPFTAAERETRAMVSAGWWPGAPQQQRQHAIAGRMLALPDGTWWLFGAWARWYRWHPSDGQWYLCPPPQATATRAAARPAQLGAPLPTLPPHVLPAGPDFHPGGPRPLPFVGQEPAPELPARLRATIESAAALPAEDYPHWWALFPSSVPSTVAATWGAMLWCAAAPVFDSRLDGQLLGLWSPYRARPLPRLDGPRWLTPPPLEALVGLYAERLRSGRVDAAIVVLRTLWAVASALRDDPRFQARADALLAVLGATLNNPTIDYGTLPYGDQALVQQWLTRCPPQLAPAVRIESSPGDNVRHAYYDLAQVVAEIAGDPADAGYIEPRLVAAALIAADLAVVRQDVVAKVVPWLDPEIRYTVQAVLSQSGHPLRTLWPKDNRLPDMLRGRFGAAGDEAGQRRGVFLATMYAADLAWCRLGGGIPARPRGFPVPTAAIAEIIGTERARAAASAQPITPPPGLAPMGLEYPPQGPRDSGGQAMQQEPPPPASRPMPPMPPGQPMAAGQAMMPPVPPDRQPLGFPAPASTPWTGHTGPAGQPEASGPPERAADDADGGFVDGVRLGPPADERPDDEPPDDAWPGPEQPPVPGPPPGSDTTPDVPEPAAASAPAPPAGAGPLGTRILAEDAEPGDQDAPGGVRPPAAAPPGTRIMSETMVGDMLDAPMPARPVGEIAPPEDVVVLPVIERFATAFVCCTEATAARMPGDANVEHDAGRLLDELASKTAWAYDETAADPDATTVDPAEPAGAPESMSQSMSQAGSEGGPRARRRRRRAAAADPETTSVDAPDAPVAPDALADAGTSDASSADASPDVPLPAVLLVGAPHTGQRRLARMIARALAEAGVGTGTFRTAHADDIRSAQTEEITTVVLGRHDAAAPQVPLVDTEPPAGHDRSVILFERLDTAIMEAFEPAAVAAAVVRMRHDNPGAALIATCEPRAYRRLAADHPELVAAFRVVRLPDLTDADARLTLLHVLADERRVTVDAAGLEVARADLDRLRGPGELVNARLVETYLDRACRRHVGRAGASRDRLVLTPEDFAGVAAEIEPALREPGDVDGFLRELDGLVGLDAVKGMVAGIVEDARAGDLAAEALRHQVFVGPPGVGKATVAGLLGGIYAALGVLDSGHLVACRPVHLAGRDAVDTELRVSAMVEQAMGGVLLIEQAERLAGRGATGAVTTELLKHMAERHGDFVIVCSSTAPSTLTEFLADHPDFRSEFAGPVEFAPFTDRELVRIFQRFAERELYLLDEELRVELLSRFARLREEDDFAYAITVRRLFDETVTRQANRLAGTAGGDAAAPGGAGTPPFGARAAGPVGAPPVTASTVARLTARDLPESPLERMMGQFQEDPRGR
ncbi:MAG TPA: AAA family ATPase [Streptosporangiaceae bacterium]|nr:AAA family ATPase [Streptosporangiaceae bacterium]